MNIILAFNSRERAKGIALDGKIGVEMRLINPVLSDRQSAVPS